MPPLGSRLLSSAANTTLCQVGAGKSRHLLKIAVSLVLAVVLFAYFLHRAPLREVSQTLIHVRLGWFLASLAVALLTYLVRALRWALILRPVGHARTAQIIGCTAAGFATSAVLPARAGELVRPLLLSSLSGLPPAGTLASILTERLLDGAAMLLLFIAGVTFAPTGVASGSLGTLHHAALLTALGLIAAVVFVEFLLRRRDATVGTLVRLLPARFRERGARFFHHLLDGLEVLRSPVRLLEITSWSLALWLLIGFQLVLLARAFDFPLNLGHAFIVVTLSVVGLAVPTPAGVGGFHAMIQFALTHFLGVSAATATAFALLHHAICFFPITVLGLAYLGAVGFSLDRVTKLRETGPPGGTG
jgi:glycosyltransferase 2 family protein